MLPASFYGTNKFTNAIPGDGSISNDSASDSDDDNLPLSNLRLSKFRKPPIYIPPSDSDTSDDENNIPIKETNQKRKPKKRTPKEKINWTLGNLPAYNENNFKFTGSLELPDSIRELDSPADFFKYFFTDELLEFITEQSNLKASQVNIKKPANITKAELEQFIGIVIFTSLIQLPSSRRYWATGTGQNQVYETMTCNRFEVIKRFLHFNDNNDFKPKGTPGHDKLFKIRLLLEKIRDRLLLIPKEEFLAVDEQIIPTKCRHELKQYNPAKPHKWGYKNQVLSGVSGFSYDFDIFAGDQSNIYPSGAPDLGVSSNVVSRLVNTVPRHVGHKIFFDNWFNSINLQVYLYKNGLLPLGTVRLNRVPNAEMPSEKDLKKIGRGAMVEKVATVDDVKLSIVSWYDNKVVNLLSAFVGSEPVSTKRRYFRKDKEFRDITSPQSVDVYNKHMGGVDLLDSLLGLYRIRIRSRQWYKKIFFHMIDMCIVNAWLLWRRHNDDMYMPLYDFKLVISEHYRKAGKVITKKRGRPSASGTPTTSKTGTPTASQTGTPTASRTGTPTCREESPAPPRTKARKTPARIQDMPLISVRSDRIDHFPIHVAHRQLCQNKCEFRSYTKCEKCNVFLCLNEKRNCFKEFHNN